LWAAIAARREARLARERFERFMEYAPLCAFTKDAAGRYTYVNPATRRLAPGGWIGRTDAELFSADLASEYAAHDRAVLEADGPQEFAETSRNESGDVRHWTSVKFPLRDLGGRRFVAGMAHDTTASRAAEARLRASESQLLLALDAGRMGIWSLDLATHEIMSSRTFAMLHGRDPDVTRLPFDESLTDVHPDDRAAVAAALEQVLRNEAPERITYRVVWPDGSSHWIEVVGRVFLGDDGKPARVAGVGFDVTEIRRAFESLERKEKLLRTLIDIQEREKQLLCQEFHDGLIQYAVGSRMMLESCRRRLPGQTGEGEATNGGDGDGELEPDEGLVTHVLDDVIGYLGKGIDDGRRVIRGIRPAVLDDIGLEAGIEDLVGQFTTPETLVTFGGAPDCGSLPKPLQLTIYRIVQESLNNAHKHAAARHVAVRLRRAGGDVLLEIADDGRGFDPAASREHGFGLIGMGERARLCGGECAVESRPGAGTTVRVRLPVQEPEPAVARVTAPTTAIGTVSAADRALLAPAAHASPLR
jgi:two-component system, NarL family, sensor histidine kinase UhpB